MNWNLVLSGIYKENLPPSNHPWDFAGKFATINSHAPVIRWQIESATNSSTPTAVCPNLRLLASVLPIYFSL